MVTCRQETRTLIMKNVDSLFENQSLWEEAIRKTDIPKANKYALRMTHIVRALRDTEDGRLELEKLLTHSKPNIRLWAAGSVVQWNPDAAVPVLAKLLYEPVGKEASTQEAVGIVIDAQGYLAQCFGLHPADLRALPSRLADMGINLPEETARRLQWER